MKGNPAFPFKGHIEGAYGQSDGMTLRDYFAAKAMQSLILAAAGGTVVHTTTSVSGAAYETADAMLRAREA